MKSILTALGMLICARCAFAQNDSNSLSKSKLEVELFGKKSISFSISPYLVDKAKATPMSGSYRLRTLYMNGFEAGPNYYINFNKNYSLIIGLHGGAAARNFKLFISKNDFNPNLKFDVDEFGVPNREYDFYICAPLLLEKRWFKKNNSYWDIVAGVNVRFYPIRYIGDELSFIYPDVNGNNVDVLEINDSIGNNLHPWLNYNIGGGYAILLRNNNYLQCTLLANFSHKKMVNGTYTINVTGKPESTGKYFADLSYIGLSFSYIFTGANKRLRKLYESQIK